MDTQYTPPITADEIIELYDKHDIEWTEGLYYRNHPDDVPRACAAGICYVDQKGPPENERLLLINHITSALGWDPYFAQGVVNGNDDAKQLARYRRPDRRGPYQVGLAIGRRVRAVMSRRQHE